MLFVTTGQEVKSGQKKKVVVLNVDMLKLEVHVSLFQNLVERKAKKVSVPSVPVVSQSHTLPAPSCVLRAAAQCSQGGAWIFPTSHARVVSNANFHSDSGDKLCGRPTWRTLTGNMSE